MYTRLTFASVVGKIYLGIHLYNTFNFHGQQTRHPDLWPLWLQIKAPDCRFVSIRFPPFKFCTQNEVIWKQLETLKSNGEYWYIQRLLGQILEINYPSKQDREEGQKESDPQSGCPSKKVEWSEGVRQRWGFSYIYGRVAKLSPKKNWSLIFSKTLLQQYYKYMEITFFFCKKHEPNHRFPGVNQWAKLWQASNSWTLLQVWRWSWSVHLLGEFHHVSWGWWIFSP